LPLWLASGLSTSPAFQPPRPFLLDTLHCRPHCSGFPVQHGDHHSGPAPVAVGFDDCRFGWPLAFQCRPLSNPLYHLIGCSPSSPPPLLWSSSSARGSPPWNCSSHLGFDVCRFLGSWPLAFPSSPLSHPLFTTVSGSSLQPSGLPSSSGFTSLGPASVLLHWT
jgi:hypothetical protein